MAHLIEQLHRVQVIGDLHEPGLLDGLFALQIDQGPTAEAALAPFGGLVAGIPLLGHLIMFSLALLNNMHSNLHPELLLRLCKFHLHWRINGDIFDQSGLWLQLMRSHNASAEKTA
jgi:hypothetical protein